MEHVDFCCVICGSAEMGKKLKSNIKGDPSNSLQVVKCGICNHAQLYPPFYSREFYEKDGQVNNVIETYGTPFETLVKHSWTEAHRRFERFSTHGIDLSKHHSGTYNVIDIGGGYGFFGCVLAENLPEANVCVLEPSQSRTKKGQELAKSAPGSDMLTFTARILDSEYAAEHQAHFDLVTMWHVLEHLEDPVSMIKNAYALLRKGGLLCVEVPNLNYDLMDISPAFFDRSFMIEHISYFTANALENVASRAAPNAEVKITGYQRYGIYNYFHWAYFNLPQGKDPDLFEGKDRMWLETTWRAAQESACTSDALFMVVRKPN